MIACAHDRAEDGWLACSARRVINRQVPERRSYPTLRRDCAMRTGRTRAAELETRCFTPLLPEPGPETDARP